MTSDNEMTNQAAQTMPELPEPEVHDAAGFRRAYTAAQMHQYARDYAASQTAGVADGKDRKDAERYRWLRDTQTSYGISAQYDDAGSPLIWLRFSGYGSNGEGTDAAIDRAMLAAAPAASGAHPDALQDGTLSKSTAKRVEALGASGGERPEPSPKQCRERLMREGKPYPRSGCDVCKTGGLTGCPYEKAVHSPNPSAASVSERARDMVTALYGDKAVFTRHDVARALEQALTQQRGHGATGSMEQAEKATFVPCDCGCGRSCCAMCGNDVGFLTPQPSADAARELAATWRKRAARKRFVGLNNEALLDEAHARELESLLGGSG